MFKTRSQATKACSAGRVMVNGMVAKPHRAIALDDRIEFEKGDWPRSLVVKRLHDKPLPKAEVPSLYEDESPPKPQLDPLERLMRRAPVQREKGTGRPTKRDRRRLEEWAGRK